MLITLLVHCVYHEPLLYEIVTEQGKDLGLFDWLIFLPDILAIERKF
jgi:hypothetical protein